MTAAYPETSARGRDGAIVTIQGRGRVLLAVCLLVAASAALSRAGAAPLEETAKRIVERIPSGSRAAQADWLFDEARRQEDGRLALLLMDEVLRRGDGSLVIEARLWKVRFWMASGDLVQAAGELERVVALPEGAPGDAECRFWRAILGEAIEVPEIGILRAPPWELLGQLAVLRAGAAERGDVRFALSLEGEVRRWGLLGAWLWRLEQSGLEGLRRAAAEIGSTARRDLAAAPERAFLATGAESGASRPEGEPGVLGGPEPGRDPAGVAPH
ncbi:MAG: hypothetical protein V1774_11725 [Candidatus Eisenbacteria bacterium]